MGGEEAGGSPVAGAPRGLSTPPDWSAIFRERPELSPPGYEACVADCVAHTAEKKRLRAEAESAKRTAKTPAKTKKPARRRR